MLSAAVLGDLLQEADLADRVRGVPGVDAQRKASPTAPPAPTSLSTTGIPI